MRYSYAATLALVSSISLTTSGQAPSPPYVDSFAVARLMRIVPTVVSETYCEGDGQVSVVQLKLRFSVTSQFHAPVVLYTRWPSIERIRVARTVEEMQAGTYEEDTFPSNMISAQSDQEVAGSAFVTLKTGQSFTFEHPLEVAVLVDVRDQRAPMFAGTMPPGTHVMRVTLRTWAQEASATRAWSDRLGERGTLLTESMVSEVIPLMLKRDAPWKKCEASSDR
jgi:hypothetical protein